MNNRQRRAAKARARTHDRTRRTAPNQNWTDFIGSEQFQVGAASLALRRLVQHTVDGFPATSDRDDFLRYPDDYQHQAIDDRLAEVVRHLIAGGWTPIDIYEVTRRQHDPDLVVHLMSAVATETDRFRPDTIHPSWSAQLATLVTARTRTSREWARTARITWPDARESLIEFLIGTARLPKIERVLPPPGTAKAQSATVTGVDERALRKVRALLAKAESTSFQEEADALTAKAQQLMTTYAIERTLAETNEPTQLVPVARRIWLDAPYPSAKSLLVAAVAGSNHAQSVFTPVGFVTIVGFDRDLDAIELLTTSLLLQATRAMTASGSQRTRSGQSRTRSFRQSFLASYANRIGERLRASAADTEAVADADSGGALLPVLATRDDHVRDAYTAMFPRTLSKEIGVSNADGWGAGRVAADLASLDVYTPITDAERAG